MNSYFTAQNCELSATAREWANRRVAELLAAWGDEAGTNPDNVKNACSIANDELPAELA